MLNQWKSMGFPKLKSNCSIFVGKEKLLKSVGVKSNHENMMKSNDEVFFRYRNENDGTCFLVDSLNKYISKKK